MRAFAHFRPFEIQLENDSRQRFDSIVFANISEMAKVATVSEDDGRPDDGKFEVITVKHTAKWRLLGTAIKAAVRGLDRGAQETPLGGVLHGDDLKLAVVGPAVVLADCGHLGHLADIREHDAVKTLAGPALELNLERTEVGKGPHGRQRLLYRPFAALLQVDCDGRRQAEPDVGVGI